MNLKNSLYYPVRIYGIIIAVMATLSELWSQEFGEAPLWLKWGVPIGTLVGAKITEMFTGSRRFLDDNSD